MMKSAWDRKRPTKVVGKSKAMMKLATATVTLARASAKNPPLGSSLRPSIRCLADKDFRHCPPLALEPGMVVKVTIERP